jgi:type IV secretory pathway VirB10-like protein
MACYLIKQTHNFGRDAMNTNRVLVLLLAVAFALIIAVTSASADYVVLKDKNGHCRVIQSNHKTPKTIAGPFKTKEEALRVKEKECAGAGTIRETQAGPAGEIRTKSEQRDEKIKKARELREEKARQKATEKQKAKQSKQEKAKKEPQEPSKPKTSQ